MERPISSPVLPFEVWWECFMLLSVAEYKSLALTCRFFHGMCLPFVLRSITYSSKLEISYNYYLTNEGIVEQWEKLNEYIERFKKLAANPRRAPLVRRCTLVYSFRLDKQLDYIEAKIAKTAYDAFVEAFIKFLPAFVELREVHFDFSKNMDKRILDALAVLPRLEQVSFISVKFGVHVVQPRIKVRAIDIDNALVEDANPNTSAKLLDIFSGERLERIQVLSRNYTPKLFRALTRQGQSTCLVYLSFELKPQDAGNLCRFLGTCPNVRSIHWHVNFDSDHRAMESLTLNPLPRSTIPLLQVFHGPAIAARAFVPRRPVQEVTVIYDRWVDRSAQQHLETVLRDLSLSSRPLTDLTIVAESTAEFFNLAVTHLPHLKKLHLELATEKVFPGEDPNDISLEAVVEEDGQPVPAEPLFPTSAHAVYMNLLHWMAHQKINLPVDLHMLYLDTATYSLRVDDMPDDESSRVKHGRPYTLSMALSILESLSVHYPALQCVVVGHSMEELTWCKGSGGKWTYSGVVRVSLSKC